MTAHYDQAGTAEALEAEGFERKLAAGLARVLRDHVMAKIESGRDEDADSISAAITQTERHLEGKIEGVRAEVARVDAKIDGVARDLSHRIDLAARDIVEKAGERAEAIAERAAVRAEAAAARTNMWMGFATVFLGLMIGASALLPAVVALFK